MTYNWLWPALTIIAIFLGPFSALLVSRFLDNSRADKVRRMDIFRTLMRTRNQLLSWDHVQALNLVELEFRKYPKAIDAWKNYLEKLSEPSPPIQEQERYQQFHAKREKLLTLLIGEIAKTLKIEVEQLEILEGNYVPQGWDDAEWEENVIRRALIEVLHGKSAILVKSQQEQLDNLVSVLAPSKTKPQ